jgi:murein DD-endopeptidase MepM/ murein hydrolase activator NlpD
MNPSPNRPNPRGRTSLSGLQIACCAAVVGAGIYLSAKLFSRTDDTSVAVAALEVAATATAAATSAQAAAEAALASLSEIKVTVQRNDTLDAIFRRLQFSLTDLAQIRGIDTARSELDQLDIGDVLTLSTRDGELMGLQRLIGDDQLLKVERDAEAGFVARVEEIPLTRHVTTTGGVIQSSLFAAGASAGVQDRTLYVLSDVFRWDVDFNRMQEGDAFTLVYEKIERDGEIIKDGNVLAAEVVHEGKTFRAVRYEFADGKFDYYTPEGVSLRKAFLKSPVKFSRISSVFNPRRRHPVLNTIRAHRGVDYAAPTGTPVYAAGAGRVQFRGVKGGFGNVVELAHSGKIVTRYGHLSRFAKNLKNGQRVSQGELIGYVGSTGLATGPHLHFEFIEGGVYVDPQKAIKRGEPGPPIPTDQRANFDAQVAPLLARLDAAPVPTGTALASR